MARSFSISGIILKRKRVGETDRIVFLLTQERGKLVCVAKGVRKLNSSKRAFMEPGNIVQAHLINTKSLPLLIQAKLIDNAAAAKSSLGKIRQLVQILEIFDQLFVEQEIEVKTYQLVLAIRSNLIDGKTGRIRHQLSQLILRLGFPPPDLKQEESILDYVQQIVERKMKSFDYLQVKNSYS